MIRRLKRHKSVLLLLALLTIVCGQQAHSKEIQFKQINENNAKSPSIVGGAPADPSKFTATLISENPDLCTATVVGRRTVLTAAHCLSDNDTASIRIGNQDIDLACTKHPMYTSKTCADNPIQRACTFDIALCYSSSDLRNKGIRFEELAFLRNVHIPRVGDEAVLVGYGCTELSVSKDRVLYIGSAKVKSIPKRETKPEDRMLIVQGGAQACPGDSGAGNFSKVDVQTRQVVGVTSYIDTSTKETFLVPVYYQQILDFLRDWGNQNSTKICGIHALPPNCY